MTTYQVSAKRSKPGWELHISANGEHVGVTEARKLSAAENQARDYVETLTDRGVSCDTFVILPDLGGLEVTVARLRERHDRVVRESREAAEESRDVVRQLKAAGLSGDDVAAVLGVSKGRVSQLAH